MNGQKSGIDHVDWRAGVGFVYGFCSAERRGDTWSVRILLINMIELRADCIGRAIVI